VALSRDEDRFVLVVADDATMHFEAGSSYRLWGAMLLNAVRRKTRIEIIESVAHENAHSRLFGLCTEEPAVQNPDQELYPSPLRVDPRPMDGVYHATFVSARMHWTMSRVIASGLLTAEGLCSRSVTRPRSAELRQRLRDGDALGASRKPAAGARRCRLIQGAAA
jgi:HEXXH motif-containing protein